MKALNVKNTKGLRILVNNRKWFKNFKAAIESSISEEISPIVAAILYNRHLNGAGYYKGCELRYNSDSQSFGPSYSLILKARFAGKPQPTLDAKRELQIAIQKIRPSTIAKWEEAYEAAK